MIFLGSPTWPSDQSKGLYWAFGRSLSNSASQTERNPFLVFGFTSISFSDALQISPLSPLLLLKVTITAQAPICLITSSRKQRQDRQDASSGELQKYWNDNLLSIKISHSFRELLSIREVDQYLCFTDK